MNKPSPTLQEQPQHPLWLLLLCTISLLVFLMLSSCTTTRYVPVVETHTETQIITDTITQRDTIEQATTTIIRELDSLQMAQYGIQLAAHQRAWLVEKSNLQRQISTLQQTHAEAVHDTIIRPEPYPVEVPVKQPSSLLDRLCRYTTILLLAAIAIIAYRHRKAKAQV